MGLSRRAYPTTAAAAALAVPGATFTNGWLCNDASGNMAPVFGGLTLTASGQVIYGQAGPRGGTDRCLEFASPPSLLGRFDGGSNFDVAGGDDLVVAWVGLWTALPSAFGAMFGKVSASFANGWSVSGTDGTALQFGCGAGSTAGSSIGGTAGFHVGSWHVGIAVIDRSTGKSRVGTQALGGAQQISPQGTASSTSFSNASNFYVGRSDWVPLNDHFRFAALYIGKAPGAATGLAAGLSASLQRFADTIGEAAIASDYAGMLFALFPPGRLWRRFASTLYSTLLGFADELVRVHDRVLDMLEEIDPSTAVELLPEYEIDFRLVAAATTAERQSNVVARLVARQRYRPVDFQQALAPLLLQDAAAVVVLERSHAFAASIGDDREIFAFFIYRDPALSGAAFIASAQALVDKIKPSHTVGTVIESVSALYDDPHSLYDRDILGA